MSDIYLKNGTEKTLILAVREVFFRRFRAPGWTDLRVGLFLSVTSASDPDTITGLAETIGTSTDLLRGYDRFWVGLTDGASNSIFLGYTNLGSSAPGLGISELVSSDEAIGTTNANFWRPKNGLSDNWSLRIVDSFTPRVVSADGSQLHLPQDTAGAGGYATFIGLKFRRDDANGRARVISMSVKTTGSSGHSGDILYTDTPTAEVMRSNLESFPTALQQLGPIELSKEPDSFYIYWPWHNSRLRIHAMGILKVT